MSRALKLAQSLTDEEIEAFLTRVEQEYSTPREIVVEPELIDSVEAEEFYDVPKLLSELEQRLLKKIDSIEINAPAGANGRDGRDGKDGSPGKDGPMGKAGKDGKDGLDGKDGISVVSAQVDFDNHLTLTLSDGTLIDAGQIQVSSENSVVQVIQGRGEDVVSYATRYDQVDATTAYKGEAPVGSADSYASWRIQKLVFGVDGDVTITWADGNTNFDNVWSNRASLTYI